MPALAADWSCGDGLMGSYSGTKPTNHTRYHFLNTDEETASKKLSNTNGVQKLKCVSQRVRCNDDIPFPRVSLFDPMSLRLQWLEKRHVGAGLVNLGNTCFLNSVLQCLSYTPPLAQHLITDVGHKRTCKMNNEFCMLCALQDHLTRSHHMVKGQAFKPIQILNNLRNIAKSLTWGQQEDAHEFLRYVVDAMQKSCLAGTNGLDKYSKETTLVHQVFGGYLRSQVKCLKCNHASNTFDPFLDISVDIKDAFSLEQALGKFVSPEILDIENAYKCERCKVKVNAQKRFTIHRASNVLTVHLKRFDMNRMLGAKVSRHIRFPNVLNVRPYMSQSQGDPVNYMLYGVLVHSGFSCNSGHYYCYVRASTGQWFCMNDSSVTQSSQNAVMDAEAYILFYIKNRRTSSYTNGKAPHTITRPDMVNGSGDYTPSSKKIIGPQLPPGLRSPPANPPSNPAPHHNKFNGAITRIILKPKEKKPITNGHAISSTVAVLAPLPPSLVPYLEPASDEENQDGDPATKLNSTATENSSTKLTLREYTARQEGNSERQTADSKTSANTPSLVFVPRAIQNNKQSKVLQTVPEVDINTATGSVVYDPSLNSPPAHISQPAESGSEPMSPAACVICDNSICKCVANRDKENLINDVSDDQRTIETVVTVINMKLESLDEKVHSNAVVETHNGKNSATAAPVLEHARANLTMEPQSNIDTKPFNCDQSARQALSPNRPVSSSRKNSVEKSTDSSRHLMTKSPHKRSKSPHRHKQFSHRSYRSRHRSSSEERPRQPSPSKRQSNHSRERETHREAHKPQYRSRRDYRQSVERRRSPSSDERRWRHGGYMSGSGRYRGDSFRRHDYHSRDRRYSRERTTSNSQSGYNRRLDDDYNRKRRLASPESSYYQKKKRDSRESRSSNQRDGDRRPLLSQSISDDDHQWVEVTKKMPVNGATTSAAEGKATEPVT